MNYTEILIHIRKIVRALNLESKRIQKEFGVSIPQLLCLGFLSESKDYKATHKQVAEFLTLNRSTVTGIISRLERKGLVARLPKMGDRRVTYITLTSAGFKMLENSPRLMHERLASTLPKLPEKDLKNIDHSLKTLIGCIGIDQTDASPIFTIDDPLHVYEENTEHKK
ncbi:MAG: MarR family winged helix-turn-helix transcriptional regulator [Bacteroidales bacterium]